jgi:hypothetical protein
MNERSIVLSAADVRAVIDGSKTQHRVPLKRQPPEDCGKIEVGWYNPTVVVKGEEQPGPRTFGAYSLDGDWGCKCPFGAPGDRLWVHNGWWPSTEVELVDVLIAREAKFVWVLDWRKL